MSAAAYNYRAYSFAIEEAELHRAYGGAWDPVYVLDTEGRVVFRRAWNDPAGQPTFDGAPIANAHQYWQEPISTTDPSGWATWWIFDTGVTLESGQSLTISFNEMAQHPIRDGFGNTFEPGHLAFGPRTVSCTITGA